MKIEIHSSIRKADEWRILRWLRIFAKMVLMSEDETFFDVKVDGKDISLYGNDD